MQDDETGEGAAGDAPEEKTGPETGGGEEHVRPGRTGWRRWAGRTTSLAGVAVIAVGAGFGITNVIANRGPAPVSSAIPAPASGSGAFQEDDNLTGQDNQDNILQSTAPGMVHILSGRTAEGTGIVLTPSGKVLTSYLPASGGRDLTVRYVMSGVTFKAQVIGEDDGLALLQLEGGDGRAFSTVTVGNSATLVNGSYSSQEVSYHVEGEVLDTAVGTSGTSADVTIDLGTLVNLDASVAASGRTQNGLLESVLQSAPTSELGGPLVDLNGRVIGITVAEAGSGMHTDGYAIPINTALAIASRISTGAAGS